MSITPNEFTGTDSERIEQALAAACKDGSRRVTIPARKDDDGRTFWLIDRAILLDSNTTLVIDNATVKLSDICRDNFIRSANCGIGITDIKTMHDIHVVGIGKAVLMGADIPRSSGDSGKPIGITSYPADDPRRKRTYGTDVDKDGENQKGDWRNIGILMARVDNLSVEGISIIDSHCWAMSFERCTHGLLSNLHFESTSFKLINGTKERMLNQDGIDLRQGCHYFTIQNITGFTGDDLVALTTIGGGKGKPGIVNSTMVSGTIPTDDDDISHVIIRDVRGHSEGQCQIVRFLNSLGTKIHDIILENVIDTSDENHRAHVTVRIGDANPAWGGVTPLGDTYGFIINNIHSYSRNCVMVAGSLQDSIITNVINHNPATTPVKFESGQEFTQNLVLDNLRTFAK